MIPRYIPPDREEWIEERIDEYITQYLIDPLWITDFIWESDPDESVVKKAIERIAQTHADKFMAEPNRMLEYGLALSSWLNEKARKQAYDTLNELYEDFVLYEEEKYLSAYEDYAEMQYEMRKQRELYEPAEAQTRSK